MSIQEAGLFRPRPWFCLRVVTRSSKTARSAWEPFVVAGRNCRTFDGHLYKVNNNPSTSTPPFLLVIYDPRPFCEIIITPTIHALYIKTLKCCVVYTQPTPIDIANNYFLWVTADALHENGRKVGTEILPFSNLRLLLFTSFTEIHRVTGLRRTQSNITSLFLNIGCFPVSFNKLQHYCQHF